jgi:hypothetical protein
MAKNQNYLTTFSDILPKRISTKPVEGLWATQKSTLMPLHGTACQSAYTSYTYLPYFIVDQYG